MNNNTVVVLGGAGLVGSLISRIFEQYGYHIRIVDRKPGEGDNYIKIDVATLSSCGEAVFHDAVAVVLALPEGAATRALPWILQAVTTDVLLMPTCSMQGPFHEAMKAISPKQRFVGINLMFPPRMSVQGRTVIICVENLSLPATFVEQHLMAAGMNLRRMTPAAHDELMAMIQSLPHAAILGFGLALSQTSVDLSIIEDIMPPPMRTMLALLSHVLTNTPEGYWNIQLENDQINTQRQALIQGMKRLINHIEEQAYERFTDDLQGVARILGRRVDSGAVDCQHIFSLLN
ncbi:prephenate dehydrogenase dimerization domain-containing protein [Pseudomonas koreensis]|uniref:prephenate dehydrogenase dimerization domain-containing protein n=1 Tax=Pseudomonas koreensis TaxID=198620 RepID=UPI003F83F292